MKLSKDARRLSRDLFRASFAAGRLDQDRVRAITSKVIDSKPRHYVDILKQYQRLLRLEIEKHHAIIESAAELDPATRGQLEQSLRAKYGRDLTAEFQVSPALIGGLRVKIGSDVYDSSVRERLSRLEDQFAQA
jgi:F-type H+-transporting ATPase subunit delta